MERVQRHATKLIVELKDNSAYRNSGNFHVKIIHVININFRGSRVPTKIFLH